MYSNNFLNDGFTLSRCVLRAVQGRCARKLYTNYVTFGFPTRVPGDPIKSCEVC